jgi:gliding motility-associated lipoprotein GldH
LIRQKIPAGIAGKKTGDLMTNGTGKYTLFIFVFALFYMLTSCNSNVVFTDSRKMGESTWNLMEPASFNVEIQDTLKSNNVYFTIRTGSDYPFRNIWLFIRTISPDGKVIGDTIQYFLMDEKGKRLGKGFGDIREINLPYKSNVYFPRKGSYKFSVQHGMRTEDLKGIYDFGLRVEKTTR